MQDRLQCGKAFAWWYNSDAGTKEIVTTDAALETFRTHLTGDDTIVAEFGVYITNLVNYVTARDPYGYGEELYTPAVSGEEIIVLPVTSGATDIPSFNGVTVPVSNITLDFTGTSITKSADENTLTASGNKWVSVLEYPSTIQYLRGVSAVKDRIYIPLQEALVLQKTADLCTYVMPMENGLIHQQPA